MRVPTCCAILLACFACLPLTRQISAAPPLPDLAIQPPEIITSPGPQYDKSNRGSQGVAAIEKSPGGRLWAAWYTGKSKRGVESTSSYVVLTTSGDDGHTWSDFKMVVQAPLRVH